MTSIFYPGLLPDRPVTSCMEVAGIVKRAE